MINFNDLDIVRARMHKIHSKLSMYRETTEVEYIEDTFVLDEGIKTIIRERLIQSFGNQSKSFELSIDEDGEGSCFDLVKDLAQSNDDDFFEVSKAIADLLAESQGSKNIPSGYFLLLECKKQINCRCMLSSRQKHILLSM